MGAWGQELPCVWLRRKYHPYTIAASLKEIPRSGRMVFILPYEGGRKQKKIVQAVF
jgi:hypothetical protein